MNVEYVQLTSNPSTNRALLADGVKGQKCLYVGSCFYGELDNAIWSAQPHGSVLGTMEVYERGGMNIYVRDLDQKVIGFIKVRPDKEQVAIEVNECSVVSEWYDDQRVEVHVLDFDTDTEEDEEAVNDYYAELEAQGIISPERWH